MRGEFTTVESIRRRLRGPVDPTQIWIGDDAAAIMISDSRWLLLAADTVVAGVHADLALTGLEAFGWKALAASISDVAAMGGEAGHALVTIAAPTGTDIDLLYEGLAAAADRFGCPIVGGDLTDAPVLVVTVAVTGFCDGRPVERSGGRPGDGLWVTGPLGRSAAGLRVLRDGARGDDPLIAAHARPVARLAEGAAARAAGATSMIDVSDGLGSDVGHLARMSAVGIRLHDIPVAGGATVDEALSGGEDFELVFSAPDPSAVEAAFALLGPPILIGEMTSDRDEFTLDGRPLEARGWEHRW